jgi:hypothetical protein
MSDGVTVETQCIASHLDNRKDLIFMCVGYEL